MNEELSLLHYVIIHELCDEEVKPPRKRKRMWSQDWYQKRNQFSHLNLMNELRISAPKDFKNFLRMSSETYSELLEKIRPLIEKKDTFMRDAITANERLSSTLRYLTSGQTFEDLKFQTAISPQSLGRIIIDTCSAIIKVLKEYIQIPKTEHEWNVVSDEFAKRWNFPNCIGAIDGKHVGIKKPVGSGSYYFNYKKTFSIVLLAVVNANYEFIMVEAGANGRVSDGGVFSNSTFHQKFKDDLLKIPKPGQLPNYAEEMPCVFVGDDAFPLLENLMKPYSGDNLSNEQRIFNYRLSRARRIVENAFGILASRFRVFLNQISVNPEKASIITLSACYLHNYLSNKNPSVYLRESVDIENTNTGQIQSGTWRTDTQQLTMLQPTLARNSTAIAKDVRRKYTNYFNGVGAVPWQSSLHV